MSTRELLVDFLSFLKKPDTIRSTLDPKQSWVQVFRLWSYLFVFIVLGSVVVGSLLLDLPKHGGFKEAIEQYGLVGFTVFAVVVGPFLEEVAFRLGMRFRLRNVLIGVVAFVSYVATATSPAVKRFGGEYGMVYLYAIAFLTTVSFVVLCLKYREKMEYYWTSNFSFIFYLFSVCFALIHIANFEEFPLRVIVLVPIIILPQLILGLGMGYLRMRFGFWQGYLFHALNNAIAVSLFIATM